VNTVSKAFEKVCNFTNDGSGAELQCAYIVRFSMSLKGDHNALMTYPKYNCESESSPSYQFFSHVNGIYKFPPPNGNLGSSCIGYRDGCNASISPSGRIVGNYFAGWHEDLNLGTINYATANGGSIENDDPSVGLPVAADNTGHVWINPNTNPDCPVCMQSSIGNLTKWNGGAYIGQGAELIRWSVNSDKWVMQKIGMYKDGHADNNDYGSNQIVCNFIDSVAINISKNPVPPHNDPNDAVEAPYGTVFYNNCAGDLWVDDPVNNPNKNSYEDLQGVWHAVPGATAAEAPGVAGRDAAPGGTFSIASGTAPAVRVHVPHQAPWKVSVAGIDGRMVRSLTGAGAGDFSVSIADAGSRIFIITLTQGGKHFVNRCVVR
jgi:hypothetical protein